jgi:hypothetical protein
MSSWLRVVQLHASFPPIVELPVRPPLRRRCDPQQSLRALDASITTLPGLQMRPAKICCKAPGVSQILDFLMKYMPWGLAVRIYLISPILKIFLTAKQKTTEHLHYAKIWLEPPTIVFITRNYVEVYTAMHPFNSYHLYSHESVALRQWRVVTGTGTEEPSYQARIHSINTVTRFSRFLFCANVQGGIFVTFGGSWGAKLTGKTR